MISFDSEGWIRGSGTVCEPSPFFDDRQADTTVNLVVMHNISLPAGVFGLGYVRALFLGHLLQQVFHTIVDGGRRILIDIFRIVLVEVYPILVVNTLVIVCRKGGGC